jgi:chromosome segregation ATPase
MTATNKGNIAWGTVIAAVSLIAGGAGTYAGMQANAREQAAVVERSERRLDKCEAQLQALAGVPAQIDATNKRLDRIEGQLDKLAEAVREALRRP